MNGLGNEFLAHAAFTLDQDCCVCSRNEFHHFHGFAEGRTFTNDGCACTALALGFKNFNLAPHVARFNRVIDSYLEPANRDGLDQIIGSPCLVQPRQPDQLSQRP